MEFFIATLQNLAFESPAQRKMVPCDYTISIASFVHLSYISGLVGRVS
jgi:hypothetical protein